METSIFDAIFVCNGHSSVPSIPKYDGIDEFQGRHLHSHDYRRAESFKGFNQPENWSSAQNKITNLHETYNMRVNKISQFIDKVVLVIGSGPSGIDLMYAISEFATTVIFSHHTHNATHTLPANVIRMGSVQKFSKNSAIFVDGTEVEITDVIFCTGTDLPTDFTFFYLVEIEFDCVYVH